MNSFEECFYIISDYLPLKKLLTISRKFTTKRIPSVININSLEEYESFKNWGRLFNPSNIITVNISISHPINRLNCLNYSIDYVPESVKNVNILKFDSIAHFTYISLPYNVENLTIDNTFADVIHLPLNIVSLTLGYEFNGVIVHFESNLINIELYGYNEGGRHPCPINDLPDSIQTMKLHVNFPGQINHWPVNATVIPCGDANDLFEMFAD
jgi:hypothetical protein